MYMTWHYACSNYTLDLTDNQYTAFKPITELYRHLHIHIGVLRTIHYIYHSPSPPHLSPISPVDCVSLHRWSVWQFREREDFDSAQSHSAQCLASLTEPQVHCIYKVCPQNIFVRYPPSCHFTLLLPLPSPSIPASLQFRDSKALPPCRQAALFTEWFPGNQEGMATGDLWPLHGRQLLCHGTGELARVS